MPPSLLPRRPLLRADAERRWRLVFFSFISELLSKVRLDSRVADVNLSDCSGAEEGVAPHASPSQRVRGVVTRRGAASLRAEHPLLGPTDDCWVFTRRGE